MMDTDTIIDALRVHGAQLRVEWPDLRLTAPHGTPPLPADLLESVRTHKDALIAALILPRLEKGANVLWAMEQRGQMQAPRYHQAYSLWLSLLCGYEIASDRMLVGVAA